MLNSDGTLRREYYLSQDELKSIQKLSSSDVKAITADDGSGERWDFLPTDQVFAATFTDLPQGDPADDNGYPYVFVRICDPMDAWRLAPELLTNHRRVRVLNRPEMTYAALAAEHDANQTWKLLTKVANVPGYCPEGVPSLPMYENCHAGVHIELYV
jgi:hypothetical protein